MEHLTSGFARTWQRPPTEAELKGLIDDHVKEEIATREAVGMGLDRDDAIIRRRLRQKLEFLVEDVAASSPPTDAELEEWMAKHPESYRAEPQVAFRQVYLSPERSSAAAKDDALKLLTRLRSRGADVPIDRLGDPSMLPTEQPLLPLREVTRAFGNDFAQAITGIEPVGLVRVRSSLPTAFTSSWTGCASPAASPRSRTIRPMVERDLLAERRKAHLDALYERLLRSTRSRSRGPRRRRRPPSAQEGRDEAEARLPASRPASRSGVGWPGGLTRRDPASWSCGDGPETWSFLWKKPTGGEIEIQVAP